MGGIVLATDIAFWLDDRGDRTRIAGLHRYLVSKDFDVAVFYAGALTEEDERAIAAHSPAIRLHAAAPEASANDAEKPLNGARGAAKRLLPEPCVALIQQIERILGRVWGAWRRVIGRAAASQVTLNDCVNPAHRERFHALCRALRPGAVIVEYIHLTYLLDGLDPANEAPRLRVVDTIDVMHLRAAGFRAYGEPHWLHITREEEARALEKVDVVAAIQSDDARMFESMLPHTRVITAGHSASLHRHDAPAHDYVNLLYVATAARPNVKSIRRFLRQVWPALRKRHGDRVRLTIAGRVCEAFRRRSVPAGVVLLGFVEDLDYVYAQADIVINPVLFGGGLKIKCVEGLCHGRAVVTTPVGAQGLDQAAGSGMYVCRSPKELLDTLDRLAADGELRRSMGERALHFAATHFSEDAAYGALADVLNEAGIGSSRLAR